MTVMKLSLKKAQAPQEPVIEETQKPDDSSKKDETNLDDKAE